MIQNHCLLTIGVLFLLACQSKSQVKQTMTTRWPGARAQECATENGWLRGSNFDPGTAINQLETWQAESFDTATINRELVWAEGIEMNLLRIYLYHFAWGVDKKGFKGRMKTYLTIANKLGIKTVFYIFDDCFNPAYHAGKQAEPKIGVLSSDRVRDPGELLYTTLRL